MEKFKIMGIGVDSTSDRPFVVLKSQVVGKELILPIWVSKIEAKSIADALYEQKESRKKRPATHDLILKIIDQLNSQVKRILIQQVVRNTLYASIVIFDHSLGLERIVDARPSDCLVLSLKQNIDIFVASRVVQENCFPAAFQSNKRTQNLHLNKLFLEEKEKFSRFLKEVKASDFSLPPEAS